MSLPKATNVPIDADADADAAPSVACRK